MEDETKHFVGKVAQKAVIEKDGKILVCQGIGDSVWEFPGGRLHIGEAPMEGVRREILEELNIPVVIKGIVHVCLSHHTKSNTWRVMIAYHCAVDGANEIKRDPTEVQDVKWISREELKTWPMFEDCREIADVFLRSFK